MSHFVRCDRCRIEDAVMGTISLPPGWQKICGADLCEPCCALVHDFIRFTSERAAALPVEPTEPIAVSPASDKLFETEPEAQVSADSHPVSDTPAMGSRTQESASSGESEGQTQPASAEFNHSAETSTEERARTRKSRKRVKPPNPAITQQSPPAPGVQP